MIVPAAEAEITKGNLYVGAAGADVVAKVGSFTHRETARPGQVTLPEDASGDCGHRSAVANLLSLQWDPSAGILHPGSGFGRTLRRRRRVVNPLVYTPRS
jgi:hypothetical protein